jgi:uncharacterized integral membrane protein
MQEQIVALRHRRMIAEPVAVAQAFTRQFVSAKSNKPQITAFIARVLLLLILLITTVYTSAIA